VGQRKENEVKRRCYKWTIVLHLVGVFLARPLSINAFADGFSDKQVQIDGLNSQGTLDDQNDLEFVGLGLWNGPLILKFSPSVRTRYSLGATVETETGEIMGKYAVRFHLVPKSPDTKNQNLKITVVDRWGNEMESEVMLTAEAAGVAIEVAATKKPQEFRISYSLSP
jgi:hypothetical protein